MGHSVASVARRGRSVEVDFALIGHQESWRAAADVLAVLRGPERTPIPVDEIKDILPWIPPRAVCHVDVGSIVRTKIGGARARGLYIDSFIPPTDWKLPTCTRTSPAFERRRPVRSRQERRS